MNLPSCKIVLHESEFFGIQTKFCTIICCWQMLFIHQKHFATPCRLTLHVLQRVAWRFRAAILKPSAFSSILQIILIDQLKFNRFLRIQITTFFFAAQNDQRPNYNHIKNHHTCPWTYIAWHLVSFFPGFYIHSPSTNLSTPLQNNIHLEKRKKPFLTWHLRSRVLI